jgi:hypothetical protein
MKHKLHYMWRIFAERHDQAWLDGSSQADVEWQEMVDEKDTFIEEQAALITMLDEYSWRAGLRWPDRIENLLGDYR